MNLPHQPTPAEERPDDLPRPVVLVVDDEPQLLEMLGCLLKALGFEPLLAQGGRRAVELYERHPGPVSVVLLDVQMPDLDGPQTLKALQRVNPAVLAVFMSAELGAYTPEALHQMGSAGLLAKPFLAADLDARLREALASPLAP
jgi:two-component system OmpR family response regulator